VLDQFPVVWKKRSLSVRLKKVLKKNDVIRSGMRVELRESFGAIYVSKCGKMVGLSWRIVVFKSDT
jgi:hypothetical protein